MLTCTRHHDICCGHRIYGHEGACANLHGHNYRFHFHCRAAGGELDNLGRVVDFGVIKETLCAWLDRHWDHRLLLWHEDPLLLALNALPDVASGLVAVPFNPTVENMARHIGEVVAPQCLAGTGIAVVRCTVEETVKCNATWER